MTNVEPVGSRCAKSHPVCAVQGVDPRIQARSITSYPSPPSPSLLRGTVVTGGDRIKRPATRCRAMGRKLAAAAKSYRYPFRTVAARPNAAGASPATSPTPPLRHPTQRARLSLRPRFER